MRPNHGWTVLQAFVLAGMLLDLKADYEDTSCEMDVKVNQNTSFETFLGEDLRINCTVEFCSDSTPSVSWNKQENNVRINISSSAHIKTEWKRLGDLVGMSFLIFQNVGIDDSGLYQCKAGGIVSHLINVSVHGDDERNNFSNDTTGSPSGQKPSADPWLYAYVAAGIVAFVATVVIITVASLRGCKGKSKKETQVENQYAAFPMSEQPFSDCGPPPLPRGSPSAPPCRRSTRRKTPPSHPNEPPMPRGGEHVCGERREDTAEAGDSILYAALKHPPPAAVAARPRRPRQETSEYAAIRVQEPPCERLTW
uniref:Ig-like domain-containing protein n=1 Tax=Gasterosteus aculeatus aculeatus TaxID=481459 RepID=A0AAQ4NPR1_GASAC|nr:uncharacterized protein LOC120824356 isoform X6 [Gasterosteus aculeatus aculeatus]